MSSTYQWIIEDTDNKGFITRVVIGLEDDDDSSGRQQEVQQQQQLQQQQQQQRVETQSEGKNSLSRRSHRSNGSRTRRRTAHAAGLLQRNSGSGSGSHHSSVGSAGSGGGKSRAYSRRPVWMTTSVYGAEQLEDSEEEREMSPKAAKWKAAAPATDALSLVNVGGGGGGLRRALPRRPNRSDDLVHPVFDDASSSHGDADEVCEDTACIPAPMEEEEEEAPLLQGKGGCEGERHRYLHLVESFARPQPGAEAHDSRAEHERRHPHGEPSSDHLASREPMEEEQREGGVDQPFGGGGDGRDSPVTATFYFTPNTNAEARASAEEAIHNGGLLYPVSGFGAEAWGDEASPFPASARQRLATTTATGRSVTTTSAMDSDGDAAQPAGPSYNKKLRKKHLRRQREAQQRGREGLDGEHLSFSAAVEALAQRAHRQLHHMPDYDSDHERRHPWPNSGEESPLETYSGGGSPDNNSPYKWESAVVAESSDEEGVARRQHSMSVSSSETDFDRFQRERQQQHQQRQTTHFGTSGAERRGVSGNGIGAPFPALPEPVNMHEMHDASGFFISPIHQLVAESTSPWAGIAGGASSIVYLGQGGQGRGAHAPPPLTTAAPPASRRRRTISSGSSFLRVPVDVELPAMSGPPGRDARKRGASSGPHSQHDHDYCRQQQQFSTASASAGGAVPVYDREMEKAAEEGLADNLSTVVAAHQRRKAAGRSRDALHCRDGADAVAHSTQAAMPCTTPQHHSADATPRDASGSADFFSDIRRARAVNATGVAARGKDGGLGCGRKRRFDELLDTSATWHGAEGDCGGDCSDDSGYFTSSSSSNTTDESVGARDPKHAGNSGGRSHHATALSQSQRQRHGKGPEDPYKDFTAEEQQVMTRLKRRRHRRRRLERRTQECGGSQILGPSPSPSMSPALALLPSSNAEMREDLLESFFMDTKLSEDDFKLF